MVNEFSQETLKNKRFEKAVEVSAQLFLKNGIESVKMTEIADECGIGVATLYRYFGTKNGITIAAMTYMWNELNKMFTDIFESDVFLSQSGIKLCGWLNDQKKYYRKGRLSPEKVEKLTSLGVTF